MAEKFPLKQLQQVRCQYSRMWSCVVTQSTKPLDSILHRLLWMAWRSCWSVLQQPTAFMVSPLWTIIEDNKFQVKLSAWRAHVRCVFLMSAVLLLVRIKSGQQVLEMCCDEAEKTVQPSYQHSVTLFDYSFCRVGCSGCYEGSARQGCGSPRSQAPEHPAQSFREQTFSPATTYQTENWWAKSVWHIIVNIKCYLNWSDIFITGGGKDSEDHNDGG